MQSCKENRQVVQYQCLNKGLKLSWVKGLLIEGFDQHLPPSLVPNSEDKERSGATEAG